MKRNNYRIFLTAAAIALATFVVYLPALRNGFVNWDDGKYIVDNPYLRALDRSFFQWAFFDFYMSNWHPLTWLSHALDYAVWGLNPAGHHFTSILLHSANTYIVVVLVVHLLSETANKAAGEVPTPVAGSVLIAAGVTGLMFGLHPLHVESVAWVSERKDLLCALFFLLSIGQYINYVSNVEDGIPEHTGPISAFNKSYVLALVFFVLALLSKPMAVSLPLVFLVLDWFPFNRFRAAKMTVFLIIEKIPFITFSFLSSVVTIFAQRASMASMEEASLATRMLMAVHAIVLYLGQMILPINLSPFHPYPQHVSILSPEYFLSFMVVLGLTITSLAVLKKQKMWLAIWSYYLIVLLPVLGIVQVGMQSMADRYTYLPSLGPFLAVGLSTAWLSKKLNESERQCMMIKVVCSIAASSAIILMSSATIAQIAVWRDGVALWSHVIQSGEPSPIAYLNRGVVFEKAGQLELALSDFDKTIDLDRDFFKSYDNLGNVWAKLGRYDKAIEAHTTAINLNPQSAESYNNRGTVFAGLDLFEKAIEDYTSAIMINPKFVTAYVNRGNAYDALAWYEMALAEYNKALSLNEHDALALYNRGITFQRIGRILDARSDFLQACTLGHELACNGLKSIDMR